MSARIFYIISIVTVCSAAYWLPWYLFVLTVLFFFSVLFFACINLSWNFFIPTLCKAKTDDRVVALTFDTLKEYNAPAAFFCIGRNIAGNEQLLRRIKNEGHIIGNHSYSHHFWFDMWSAAKMMADMQQMNDETVRITGLQPLLFRPPYGVINPNLAAAIKARKYTSIGWSIRSFDTRIKDKEKLLSRIMAQVRPGGIILLHDSMEITAVILPELIQQLRRKGYTITRADKMLNITAYA